MTPNWITASRESLSCRPLLVVWLVFVSKAPSLYLSPPQSWGREDFWSRFATSFVVLRQSLAIGFLATWAVLAHQAAADEHVYGTGRVEHEATSAYSHIRIRRQGDVRTLLFVEDRGKEVVESAVDLSRPQELLVPYTRVMFASYLLRPQQDRVLLVGLGGGAMIHFLKHHAPHQRVDVVEIDPLVVSIADEYFGIRSGTNLAVILSDGIQYLETTQERYDVIYMDAFLKPRPGTDSTGIPLRLQSVAFLKRIQEKLTPNGLVVFNLHRVGTVEHDTRAIRDAFAQTYVFRVPARSNRVVVASCAKTREHPSVLRERAEELDRTFATSFSFQEIAENLLR